MKQKDIAKAINVSPSTVSREIRRNSGIRGHYNWETAQANAVRAKRKKPGNRSVDKDVMEEAKRFLLPNSGLRNKYLVHWPMMASIFVMKPYTV
nr:helix-turn-helix domain-containing protein [Prevotella corporis]